jgi:hypothetical protein
LVFNRGGADLQGTAHSNFSHYGPFRGLRLPALPSDGEATGAGVAGRGL